jgi:hypothetical protein
MLVSLMVVIGLLVSWSPAAGYSVVGTTGAVGPYSVHDTGNSDPGALCGYVGSPVDWFRWMRVRPPAVEAIDRTGARDHQIVGWRFKLQKGASDSGPWTTVETTPQERATAYDDANAPFVARKAYWQGPSHTAVYRAIVSITWYHAGMVEGRVKLRLQYYRYHAHDASPTYVRFGACQNQTD